MRRPRSIYNFAAVALSAIVLVGCGLHPARYTEETPPAQGEERVGPEFNPLGLPGDTVIVTSANSAAEKRLQLELAKAQTTVQRKAADSVSLADSLNHQLYRVQLLTVESYSDARKELAIAEEIFDRAVSLNYDLPYYKLRVGEFATKAEADSYLQKAKNAGYANAWVVLATVGVKELKSLYITTPQEAAPVSADSANVQDDQ